MLNRIISFSIKNKLIIGLFVIALIAYGSYEVTRLPIDAVPDITNNQVQVITVSPALGAPDIERLITFPIEQVNSNIPGLKEIRSFSRFGLSVVTIVFNDEVDVYWGRQQVTERLRQADIPTTFGTPQLAPVTTGLGEIYQYTVRPKAGYEDKFPLMELRSIQDWIIRRQLLGVKGVADVASFGGELKQYEIAVDPARLKANNVTINDVFDALQNNNQNTGGAYIEKGPSVLFIRSEGLVGSIGDIQQIVVKNLSGGIPLLIRDVAEVGLGHATRYGAMSYNGRPQGAPPGIGGVQRAGGSRGDGRSQDDGRSQGDERLLSGGRPRSDAGAQGDGNAGADGRYTGLREVSGAVVMMLKGANSNEVIKNIKERIAMIQRSLPEGVMIDPFLDRTKMVDHAIGTVERNLMEGALIVVFVLVIFLGNLRAGLLVASIIPLSMLFAIIMMNLFGVSGNLMSLGALDFGLIVDGAVIIVEAVMHRFRPGALAGIQLTRQQMDGEVKQAAGRMMNSAVFGQIIILIVYLPIFTLQGIEGKMFKPMAQTVAFALLGAFLLSVTYIPMMSTLVLSRKIASRPSLSDRLMDRLEKSFRTVLGRAFHYPKIIIGSVGCAFVVAVLVLTRLGGEFIPSLEEGDFAVETRVLPGSSIRTSLDAISIASNILLAKFPEVEKVVGKTGSSEIPNDPMPLDASDMIVSLKNKDQWMSARTFPELEAKMRKELEAVPGVTFGFQYPVQMRFNELMTGARQDIVCKIFGADMDTLALYARKLGDIMSKIKGGSGLYVETVSGMPQIVIEYDRMSIARYGLSVNDINRVVNTAFAGQSSGLVYEGEQRYDLVVRLGREQRQGIRDVQDLLLPVQGGVQIPLRSVANVRMREGPIQIQREDAQRRIIVGCNVRGRDVQSMVKELQQKAETQLHLPPGYFIKYGGAFENLEAAKKRLFIAVPVSLVLIFLLLYFAFRSVRQGLLIYSAIPLSATGGIFALALRGMPFSISAGVGFIALFGVAVLNGIVLISEYKRRRGEDAAGDRGVETTAGAAGDEESATVGGDLKTIILDGTSTRLRPVLMTAFVASLGFLPMALSNGAGAEVQRPLATVVIGGLLIATLLTLFLLPLLYFLTERRHSRKKTIAMPMALLIVFGSLMAGQAHAQTSTGAGAPVPITLTAAIDSAIKNNLSLKGEKLNATYLEKLKGTAYAIPQTNAIFEYGQMNSAYADNKVIVSQSIRFPTVYARQRSLYEQEWKNGVLNAAVRENELRKQVSLLYYMMIYLQQKQQLLAYSDSLFNAFLRKATQRFNQGESNLLEKITAETQAGQIGLQVKALQQDLAAARVQFKWLLHTTVDYTPVADGSSLPAPLMADTPVWERHPFVQQLEQQQRVSEARLKLEKSRLSPDLFAAYSNMSIRGDGADGKTYGASTRFQSMQVGVGIPLFARSQKNQIAASRVSVQVADNNYAEGLQAMQAKYQEALEQYKKYSQSVTYFESIALKNADTIIRTADLQFTEGSINYLDWVLLVNNAITIRSEYIDAVRDRNQYAIAVNNYFIH